MNLKTTPVDELMGNSDLINGNEATSPPKEPNKDGVIAATAIYLEENV